MHFYSALLQEGKIFCSSQWFIYGGFVEKKNFFRRWDQKSGFNLSTLRNTFQHSLLLKIHHSLTIFIKFFLPPWCRCTPFYSRRARYSVHLHDSSSGDFMKRSNFFIDETKKSGFNLSRLRKTLQQSLILKFHHALSIFINFLFAALVHFYSIFFWCKIICSS